VDFALRHRLPGRTTAGHGGSRAARSLVPLLGLLCAVPCIAQDLEPRRWTHLPSGGNFTGGAYAYTSGDIFFNPVLRIEDATLDLQTAAVSHIRSFELFGKSARFDLLQTYQSGRWRGLLDGAPASTERL
jgi:hypothetical protein